MVRGHGGGAGSMAGSFGTPGSPVCSESESQGRARFFVLIGSGRLQVNSQKERAKRLTVFCHLTIAGAVNESQKPTATWKSTLIVPTIALIRTTKYGANPEGFATFTEK